jgi:prepilin-type N-terminal cleavage/methylation domain-containing protein
MHKSSKGFSLVETILAIAILAFAVCAILQTYATCFALSSISENMNTATNAAQGLLEEMRSSSYVQLYDNYHGLIFTVNDIPNSRGIIYVDDTNPELLKITVTVCWKSGSRVIGEDRDLDGVLDPGEDVNGNGMIDSVVKLVTLIANR